MKSKKKLESFVTYCMEHPEERFWQALRNWSGYKYILGFDGRIGDISIDELEDTFYKE